MNGMRLLVVEDDAALARVLERGLREAGHHVERLADGARGLSRLRAGGLDACVLDVMLPGLDGFSVVAEAHADRDAHGA
jgi:DNA-binding response OmpR family regulator